MKISDFVIHARAMILRLIIRLRFIIAEFYDFKISDFRIQATRAFSAGGAPGAPPASEASELAMARAT